MRLVAALKRNSRISNRSILRIIDNPCNHRGFLTALILTVSCRDAQRRHRNIRAEHQSESKGVGNHQEVFHRTGQRESRRRAQFFRT